MEVRLEKCVCVTSVKEWKNSTFIIFPFLIPNLIKISKTITMNKSIKNVISKLKDHPNVEFFPKHKLGQFVGKVNERTEMKRRMSEIDLGMENINEEMKNAMNK